MKSRLKIIGATIALQVASTLIYASSRPKIHYIKITESFV